MKKKLTKLSAIIVLFCSVAMQLNAQTANFTASPTSGCAPLNVTFTNTSTGASSYAWNFGNGNTSTQTSPSAVYSIAGTYTVTLTANGSSTHTLVITVYANPVASFTTSAMPSCAGNIVTFTSTTTLGSGPISSYAWDFGDGNGTTTATGTTTHSYGNGGTFPVNLIVTDIHGCTSSVIVQVTILAAPVASFTGFPNSSCTAPLLVNFTNTSTSTGITTCSWSFGDGGTSTANNPTHTYTATGSYTVTLIVVQGGCSDTIVMTNYINIHNIIANFTSNVTSGCVGTAITFTDLSSPLSVSRNWNFGDGGTSTLANPTHVYGTPGTYTVSLLNATDPSGCSDSHVVTGYITIYPSPVVNFTANQTVGCSNPFNVTFNNTSTGGSTYSWSFGDGGTSTAQNPTHPYTTNGNFTVTLTVTSANGCVSTFTRPAYIHVAQPIPSFYGFPHLGCAPLLVNFVSTSFSPNDPIVSYLWTFGDGSPPQTTATSTTSHLYNLPGTYTVTLQITTAAGCVGIITLNNYVQAGTHPTGSFTIVDSIVCFGTAAVFNSTESGNADSVFWMFGDGGTYGSHLPYNPATHVYNDTGSFNVTLIVLNHGCPDTIVHNNIVHILPPRPYFSFVLNCVSPLSVAFTNTSFVSDSIVWNFNDGSPIVSNVQTPTHIYTTQGGHSATITAWNFTTGCSSSWSNSFFLDIPVASFTVNPPAACYPMTTTLSSTSQNAYSYLWTKADGDIVPFLTVTADTFLLPAVYNEQLTITDVHGCTSIAIMPVDVDGPVPNFAAVTVGGCTPFTAIFNNQTIDDTTQTSWTWNFGDGTVVTVSTPNVTHTYLVSGTYSVTMSVTDIGGCTKTFSRTNYIQATFPTAVMVADTFACAGDVLTFNASGTSAAGPATYFWTFGDSTPIDSTTGAIVTHIYNIDSTYTLTYTVRDANGCEQTIIRHILIQTPTVSFRDSVIAEGCGFTTVQFFDMSTGININQWHWTFGDGASSTQQNPTHTYSVPGYYTVSLTATNCGPCSGTSTQDSLVLVQGPVGTFSFFSHNGCNPLTVYFVATGTNISAYTWDFGDGTVITTTTDTIRHTYTQDIFATPILLLTDTLSNGTICQLPAPTAGTVSVITTISVNIDSTIIVLDEGETEPLNSTVTTGLVNPTFLWTPSTLLGCDTCQNTTVTGDNSGQTIVYVLTVTDAGGCKGRDTVRVIYLRCDDTELLIPNVFSPNGDMVNDFFDIKGECLHSKFLIQIFNRWGVKVFETTDRYNSWDGRINGGPEAVDGVYYYVIDIDKTTYTGFVQIVR